MASSSSSSIFDDQPLWLDASSASANITASLSPTVTPTEYSPELDDDYYNNKWLLILPRISGFISLLAVLCVALEAFQDMKNNQKKDRDASSSHLRTTAAKNLTTVTHIQFFYQLPLCCYALGFFLGSTTMPSSYEPPIWGALGSQATCTLQGILMQFGIYGTVGWDAALSVTYICLVRYRVADLQLKQYQKYFHGLIWPLAFLVTIYPLTQDMYNVNGTICWLESYPNNCEGDECLRGEGAPLWQSITSLYVMVHYFFSVVVLICLYRAIRNLENITLSSQRRSHNAMSDTATTTTNSTTLTSRRKASRAIGVQGMLYASGMLITGLPTPIYILLWNTTGAWSQGFAIFATAILPLLGYVNFIIFMRKRQVEQCRTRYGKFLRQLHSPLFDYQIVCHCSCQTRDLEDDSDPDVLPSRYSVLPWHFQKVDNSNQDNNIINNNNNGNGGNHLQGNPNHQRNLHNNNKGQHYQYEHQHYPPEVQEQHPAETTPDDEEAPAPVTTGPWSGFLLKTKKVFFVSELGASRASVEESEVEAQQQHQHQSKLSSTELKFNSDKSPTQPRRIKSGVTDDGDDDEHDPEFEQWKQQQRRLSSTASPPVKPVRLETTQESEWEDYDSSSSDSNFYHHSKPVLRQERCTSEGPPPMPERMISEIDTPGTSVMGDDEASGNRHNNSSHGYGNGNTMPPSMPVRYLSEKEASDPSFYQQHQQPQGTSRERPPSMPIRLLSEKEPSDSTMGVTSHATTPTTTPPSKPVRYLSTDDVAANPQFLRTFNPDPLETVTEVPPTQPMRHASNPDLDASGDQVPPSDDSSQEIHFIPPMWNPLPAAATAANKNTRKAWGLSLPSRRSRVESSGMESISDESTTRVRNFSGRSGYHTQ